MLQHFVVLTHDASIYSHLVGSQGVSHSLHFSPVTSATMVGKRGPGSRRPGPPKRVSKKAQTAKAKSAAASTQQAIRLSPYGARKVVRFLQAIRSSLRPKRVSKKAQTAKAKSAAASTQQAIRLSRRSSDGAVKVATGRMKSTDKAGSENLSTIVNKALVELNEHLLEIPHKILVLLRVAKKESYFKKAVALPSGWLHPTLVHLKNAGKGTFRDALIMYSDEQELGWTAELLSFVDRSNGLQGIEMIACFLGHFSFDDNLPKLMHYKPLFRKVMVAHWLEGGRRVTIDESTGKLTLDPPLFRFVDKKGPWYGSIEHVPSKTKVNISEDLNVTDKPIWRIEDGWSWLGAALCGKQRMTILQTCSRRRASPSITTRMIS